MNIGRLSLLGVFAASLIALFGCSVSTETVTVGVVIPLTGPGAESYGDPARSVIEYAVDDINEGWQSRNMRLEVVFADGKCTSADALEAATDLVQNDNVKIIYGGICSSETLGIAPFAEENRILLLTPLSGSSKITDAGDFVFRTIYSNGVTAETLIGFIEGEGYGRVAILAEDTSYSQDLRSLFISGLGRAGVSVAADEVVAESTDDVTENVNRAVDSNPDAIIILPQTVQTANLFVEALADSNFDGQAIGNDVVALDAVISEYTDETEGYVVSTAQFASQGTDRFAAFQEEANCYIGHYCANLYDGITLLSEQIETCGTDTECIRDALYATQNWQGTYFGSFSFDENGDIAGTAQLNRVSNGNLEPIR